MPNTRGRPPRPPRHDRAEIRLNADRHLVNAKAQVADMISTKLAAIDDDVDVPEIDLTQILAQATLMPPPWVLDLACNALGLPFVAQKVKRARVAVANTRRDALTTPIALGLVDQHEGRAEALQTVSVQVRGSGVVGAKARLMLFLNAKAKFEAFAATFPTPAEYQDVLLGFYVPIFNAAHVSERRCVECGQEFALRRPREVAESRHCSEPCQRRASKRGRERVGNGRSAVENVARKFGVRLERHMKQCARCNAGKDCPTFESLLAMSNTDALDRLRGEPPKQS